jgi:hypothetical protein
MTLVGKKKSPQTNNRTKHGEKLFGGLFRKPMLVVKTARHLKEAFGNVTIAGASAKKLIEVIW